jgi:hypothetical protein
MGAKIPSAITDELGHFQINHLWLGKFAVSAKKEDEGSGRGTVDAGKETTKPTQVKKMCARELPSKQIGLVSTRTMQFVILPIPPVNPA